MPNIRIIEDAEATGDIAEVYDQWRAKSGRRMVPGILKCFSARPDFLRQVIAFSDGVHFSDGHLPRRVKEMIATYVSALNHCPFWIDAHAYFLREQGADEAIVQALAKADLAGAPVTEQERALLEFTRLITEKAHTARREDTDKLRQAGWTDEQIAEGVYIIAMFAFFNRVADAFGIEPMGYLAANRVTR